MKNSSDFIIPFKGLSIGEHHFDFDLNKEFFEKFKDDNIQESNLKLNFRLSKEERMMTLTFNISGIVGLICDRCLELMDYRVDINKTLFIKFGDLYLEESEDVIIIPEADFKIDISNYIFEFIILFLPFKKVHPDDDNGNSTCSREMLSKLEEYKKNESIDPRWGKLNELKNKLK